MYFDSADAKNLGKLSSNPTIFQPEGLSLSGSFVTSQKCGSSMLEGYEMSDLPGGVFQKTFVGSTSQKEINMTTAWTPGNGGLKCLL